MARDSVIIHLLVTAETNLEVGIFLPLLVVFVALSLFTVFFSFIVWSCFYMSVNMLFHLIVVVVPFFFLSLPSLFPSNLLHQFPKVSLIPLGPLALLLISFSFSTSLFSPQIILNFNPWRQNWHIKNYYTAFSFLVCFRFYYITTNLVHLVAKNG